MLAMQVGQHGAKFTQPALRDEGAVDEGAGTARADFTTQDELAIFEVGVELLQALGCRAVRFEFEQAFHDTALGT